MPACCPLLLSLVVPHPPLAAAAQPRPPGCRLQLERIATGGILFVALLAGVFVYYAVASGFPAVASGELPLFRPALAAHLPEAVAVLSFA